MHVVQHGNGTQRLERLVHLASDLGTPNPQSHLPVYLVSPRAIKRLSG